VSALSEHLSTVLADATTFYFRTHAAHWNVTGDEFQQFHELFGEIYEDVRDSLDPIAENIRKIDEFPPSSLDEIVAKREIKSPQGVVNDAQALLKELVTMNDGVIDCLNESFAAATSANQQGIANFLTERIDMHQKWRWQMKASMEAEEAAKAPKPAPAPKRNKVPPMNPVLKKVAPMTARPPKVA
jgi:starvation-inducible DNA-binding protein